MKVCQINCVFGVGSTGKITQNLHNYLLENGIKSFVIFAEGQYNSDDKKLFCVSNRILNGLSAAYRRLTGRQYDGAFLQTNRILNILKKERPDVVHLQCINGNNINNYRLLKYLSDSKTNTVVTLHAEFMYTGGCGHAFDCNKWHDGCHHCAVHKKETQCILDGTRRTWKKRKKSYSLFKKEKLIVTAVSPWLAQRASVSMLGAFDIHVVMNGVNVDIFRYAGFDSEVLKKYGIPLDKRIVFYPTAIFNPENKTDLKGSKYILELSEMIDSNTIIVVASNYGCVNNLPNNVYYIGRTKTQQDLASLYNCASVTIVLSKRETFSMPTAESLCCGTPVVGFECGGAESIALKNYSTFVPYGSIESFSNAMNYVLGCTFDRKEISREGIKQYANSNMSRDYVKLYSSFDIDYRIVEGEIG